MLEIVSQQPKAMNTPPPGGRKGAFMTHTRVGDDLRDVRIIEDTDWGRELEFDVSCYRCGKIFTRYTYDKERCYSCDECKKELQKKAQEEAKAKKKELENKVLKKFRPSVKKAKVDMCEHFCIIPRLFADKKAQEEACTCCPFLRIEGGAE